MEVLNGGGVWCMVGINTLERLLALAEAGKRLGV
jgi:hypothetical protein